MQRLTSLFLIMGLVAQAHAADVLVVDNGGISINGGQVVVSVTTDPTLAGATDAQIPSAAAIKSYIDTLLSTELASVPPVGSVFWHAASTPPAGYLACDGSAVSRTTYNDLFSAIGIIYGVGDGSTTFNLPDLRGEFVRGWDNGRGVDTGRSFGSFQSFALQSHSHGYVRTSTGDNSGLWHTNSNASIAAGSWADNKQNAPEGTSILSHGGPETRPRNIALLPIIKH